MKLSERLETMLHARLTDEDSIIREAIDLAKRYENAPVCWSMENVGPTMAYAHFEDPPGYLKGEFALVPLPQQSET